MELQEIFSSAWIDVVWRLILNTLMVTLTGRYIYLKRHRGSREYFFTYISISVIITFIIGTGILQPGVSANTIKAAKKYIVNYFN